MQTSHRASITISPSGKINVTRTQNAVVRIANLLAVKQKIKVDPLHKWLLLNGKSSPLEIGLPPMGSVDISVSIPKDLADGYHESCLYFYSLDDWQAMQRPLKLAVVSDLRPNLTLTKLHLNNLKSLDGKHRWFVKGTVVNNGNAHATASELALKIRASTIFDPFLSVDIHQIVVPELKPGKAFDFSCYFLFVVFSEVDVALLRVVLDVNMEVKETVEENGWNHLFLECGQAVNIGPFQAPDTGVLLCGSITRNDQEKYDPDRLIVVAQKKAK